MMRALHTAASGMGAQQLYVDNISHNLANVNTTGFKKSRLDFQDLLYMTINRPVETQAGGTSTGLQVGLGTHAASSTLLFTTGNLQHTGNPLDLAISGRGFFVLEGPNRQEYYTRDGSFKLNKDGYLVSNDGYRVAGVDDLDEDASEIMIASDGKVTYLTADGKERNAGTVELRTFINPGGLERVGQNLYLAGPASGEGEDWSYRDDPNGGIRQYYLEMSNVQVVDEMVSLISAQRAYEINAKAIQSSDEMLGIASNLRR